MTSTQVFFPKENSLPSIATKLLNQFPNIAIDPDIHSGWPHIKGTRVLATDILRAQIQGYSLETMIMEFKEMGVKVTKEQLVEACRFTIKWMNYLDEKKASKSSR